MYSLKFTLKQHTPIIHFQHDQDGATLRATEVKPKLDRFIIKKIGGDKKYINQDWLQNSDSETNSAFDYKLRFLYTKEPSVISIENINNQGKDRDEKFPLFFGLLGDKKDDRHSGIREIPKYKFSYHTQNIIIEIQSYKKDLLDFIAKQITEFFLKHNFGTRQSKGFGSFAIERKGLENSIELNSITKYKFTIDAKKINARYQADYNDDNFKKYYNLFYANSLFYNTLRSGLNQYDKGNDSFYFKSFMFLYGKDHLKAQWDKKAIKENFLAEDLLQEQRKYKNTDVLNYKGNQSLLLRDLLGLASESEWKAVHKIKILKSNNPLGNNKEKEIARYTSPLLFKIIEIEESIFEVYIILNQESLRGMLDQSFTIESGRRNFKLDTPKEFILDDFLRFAIKTDLRSHIEFKYGSSTSPDFQILNRIYDDLKRNLY